ncbi:energy transducer TonB [Pseudohongiella sp. O18]|uniref:energy transducer TonB n=1 Tax=Pseudohongiella sp. O18 TaxID=2904248 RepID=UPI001F3DAF48|nr:energy transducer TonB [Pseudohongiella sp. O18]
MFAQSDLLSLELDLEGMPRLIHEVEPRYPARAVARGIEGWVQVKFTIMADGTVDPLSIEIADADPWGMFNSTAIRAIEQFRYEPRVVDGVAVEMPNYQHVFRFEL